MYKPRLKFKRTGMSMLALALLVLVATYAHSTSVPHRNLAALTNLAEWIFVGKVVSITDNYVEGQFPYIEITFKISKSIKGGLEKGTNFSYRQIGLLTPRDAGNGMRIVFAIDGFPQYQIDKEVMVFLYKPSAQTDLSSPVGLLQGKFTIEGAKIFNDINNNNLFANMNIDPAKLSKKELDMLSKTRDPVNTDTFINLVSRAVKEGLFE